jgi:hypothetical protein
MKRSATLTIGAIACLICAAAQAQTTPSNSAPTTPSSTASSSTDARSDSQLTPRSGKKDTSRGAKEQQSQTRPCPKNGNNSNVNCKERTSPPKQ